MVHFCQIVNKKYIKGTSLKSGTNFCQVEMFSVVLVKLYSAVHSEDKHS